MALDIIFSTLISLTASLISELSLILRGGLIIFSLCLYLYYKIKIMLSITFITTLISFALSYIMYTLTAFLLSIITAFFYYNHAVPFTLLSIPIGLLQFLLIYKLFQINRFKKGMPFIFKSSFINSGATISLFIIALFIILPHLTDLSLIFRLLPPLTIFLLALLLMVWWRRRITQTYIERIRSAELESLRKENEEKDRKIKELMDNNDRLAGIIHKDNKLLPAMEAAVSDYLSNASSMTDREQKEYGKALLTQLEDMLHARKEVLTHYQNTGKYQSKTGIGILDGVCSHMEQLAQAKGISMDFKIDENLKEKIPEHVNEHDIGHLLSDLCTNAMHAVENMDTKKLAVHLGTLNDFFTVEVEDSGMEFDISVYQDLGLERHTTHKETGGSGIGLMDIWKLKQKYGVTLQIQEYFSPGQNFTKKISLIFDKKNLFLLYSYRYPHLKTQLSRNDLILLAYNFITSN